MTKGKVAKLDINLRGEEEKGQNAMHQRYGSHINIGEANLR